MKTKFILFLSLFLLFNCIQKISVEKVPVIPLNFEAAKAYFTLVEKIQKGGIISEKEWSSFFNIEGNKLFIEDLRLSEEDISMLKKTIRVAYQPKVDTIAANKLALKSFRLLSRIRYKKNHQLYKDYLAKIERIQITFVDSIIAQTKAFLPKDLMIYRAMPTIYYHALNSDGDATANNRIFMSVLASYERNSNRIGNVEAHELHHNFRPDLSYYKTHADSAYYRTEIEAADRIVYNALMLALNEGLADMVDKDLLLADTSKWWRKDTIQALYMREGENVVKKLNEYLAAAANGANQDLELYQTLYSSYNGHIPGYFMAKAIKDNGRLGEIIEHAGNPFIFFLTYQEVALNNDKLPAFDDVVIDYLEQLNIKYMEKLETKWEG
ncbi:MAG: DUF5700 domain-containing putative Zn-dependent protease [Saprospiraceae bacterium]